VVLAGVVVQVAEHAARAGRLLLTVDVTAGAGVLRREVRLRGFGAVADVGMAVLALQEIVDPVRELAVDEPARRDLRRLDRREVTRRARAVLIVAEEAVLVVVEQRRRALLG